MKIQKIKSISQYGIFSQYDGNSAKVFGVNNIIFGWNYSGKTTLSRIFRSIEKRTLHSGFLNGKFRVLCSDGNEITEANVAENNINVRVFNPDYIQENLRWEQPTGGIEPILMVGEENIELQTKLAKLSNEKQVLLGNQSQLNGAASAASAELNSLMTNEATRITNDLSLGRNFRKPDLQQLIDDDSIGIWLLPEYQFNSTRQTALSTEKLESLSQISLQIDDSVIQKAANILSKCVTPSKTIARLKEQPDIENWVRTGRKLHENQTVCQFCSSPLPTALLNSLDEHFSKEYEAFRREVEGFISELDNYMISFNPPDKNAIYKDLQQSYLTTTEATAAEAVNYNNFIEIIKKQVTDKLNHLAEALPITALPNFDYSSLSRNAEQVNGIIIQNNQRTKDFDRIKQDAIALLKKHYAAQFHIQIGYKERKESIQAQLEAIAALNGSISEIEAGIQTLLGKISETAKGADSLNKYLKLYFGNHSPICIHVDEANLFRVDRNGSAATNLSEGEKTAISFAHFLTSLNDKNNKDTLAETIVYVDDPLSSLDKNHLYNTYALISSCVKGKCGQLFVSTHNFEFFNLLKDEFKKQHPKRCIFATRNNHECDAPLFQIIRTNDNAEIRDISCLLCHFKTEYYYLFYQLCQFKADDDDHYRLFTMPNIMRRFLEIYFGFMHPSKPGIKANLPDLFPNTEQAKAVNKILDEHSHSENTERVLQIPTTEEVSEAIKATFNAIGKTNPLYFNELKACVLQPDVNVGE